ncbi:MAG: YiiX/YebB-like N1pC/P60 family cysteine hydrolase [Burkholderiales bacterium]
MHRTSRVLAGLTMGFALLSAACTMQVNVDDRSGTNAPLAVQRKALDPRNGGRLMVATELQAGDILLSSAPSLTSAGVRLLTLAPVSHASLYVGSGRVVEAVGKGVRERPIAEVIDEESVIVAFRHPDISEAQAIEAAGFARGKVGTAYNHVGIVLQAPFSLQRRICEVPLLPTGMRDLCVRGIGAIQLGVASKDRFFCSQLVLEAYRRAGLPLTDADPRLMSPVDILHMREGDVPTVRVHKPLAYVGHLKFLVPASELTVSD